MNEEHKDGTETIVPVPKPPMQRTSAYLILAGAFVMTAWWGFAYTDVPYVRAEQAKPAATETAKPTYALATEVVMHVVKPNGLDATACAQLPYDGSATCRDGDAGQKIVRVSGQYRRITCGYCLKFTYPKDIQTTVDVTVNGGAR